MSDASSKDGLVALLTEKNRLLDEFLALTRAQAALLDREEADPDALTSNLNQRERVIRQIDGLRGKIDALTGPAAKADGRRGPDPEKDEADRLLAEIRDKLLQSRTLDEKNREAAQKHMAFFGREIEKSQMNRKAIGALGAYYQIDGETESEYFDKMR